MSNPGSILYPANAAAFQVAKPVDYPTLSNPFPRINVPYVLEQRFQMWGNSWTPLALGTDYTDTANFSTAAQWTDYAGFKLVNESPRTSINGGFVEWTRTFAKIPDRFEEPMTATYGFIAFYPGFASVSVVPGGVLDPVFNEGRASFQDTVYAVCIYDFAVLSDLSDTTSLPIVPAQAYGFKNVASPYTPKPDYFTTEMLWRENTETFTNPGAGILNTNPTQDEYIGWVNEDETNYPDGNPAIAALGGTAEFQERFKYWMVAEDSNVETWMGLISMRKTILIRPQ